MATRMDEAKRKAAANIYKTLKEDFYANLSGGSITEITIVVAVSLSCYILYSVLQSKRHIFSGAYGAREFFLDFLINVGGLLLSITLYSGNSWVLHLAFLAPAAFFYLAGDGGHKRLRKPKQKIVEEKKEEKTSGKVEAADVDALLPRKAFLTTYRGGMMVVTCLAILAVDFPVFPRRFAKVETLGTSMMDLGVGSFVFSSGLVSSRTLLKNAYLSRTPPLTTRLLSSLRSSATLLFIGILRLLLTRGADYHEHVSEYGLHWNFFITLGFLPPFTAAFQSLFALVPSYAFWSMVLGVAYELTLDFTGLKFWILNAPRVGIISANKEGIFSFFGYLAIFLAGQALGMSVLPRSKAGKSPTKALLIQASLWTVAFLVTTRYSYGFNIPVSRRIANLPYVLWVGAYNCWQILGFWAVERVFFGPVVEGKIGGYEERVPMILRAINRNGLVVFLVANILTGIANKTVDTIHASTAVSMGILSGYAMLVAGFAVYLEKKDITIKF